MKVNPYFIGIAGGSASGKTTFANQLAEQLKERKVKVFHMDQYFKKEEDRPIQVSFMNQKSYRDDNSLQSFDLKQFYQDLKLAKQGTDEFIIIEGLFTLYDSTIYNFLDLKIFIDCRADERIVRRLKRNMNRGLTFDEISQVYLDLVRFRHDEFVENSKWKSDFIINGSKKFYKIISIIKLYLLNKKGSF